jgi:ribonuclease J
MPGYGFHSMLKQHKEIAIQKGEVKEDNVIVADNGSVIEITGKEKVTMLKRKVPSEPIMVDGNSIMYMQKTVLDDRKLLSHDGFINIVVLINISKQKIQKSPDILSRGFLYLRDSKDILDGTRILVIDLAEKEIERAKGGKIDVDKLKEQMSKKVEKYLFKETGKTPVIIPLVLVV